ncbi:MAG TPA: OmpA family protein [Cellvibrionaceae bacterium]
MLRLARFIIGSTNFGRWFARWQAAWLRLEHLCFGLVVCALLPLNAQAITYSNFIENGGWSNESSLLACRLTHTIPYLGKAEFEKPAGEPMAFRLKTNTPTLKTGQAQLVAAAPVWKSSALRRDLGFVPVQERKQQVAIEGFKPERMLAELFDGQELLISRKPRYGGDEISRVAITPIGFRAAYRDYTACLALLLPVNFDQIQRTSIYFGSNQSDLTASEQNKLDNIVAYLKADPIVQEFFIDGHTDSVGSQPDNMTLAKKRAEVVSHYLIKQGMPKDAFWVRWHGERYPVAENNDRLGRAKNRRVTVRLETEKTQGDDKGNASPGGDTRPAEPGAPSAPASAPPATAPEATQATLGAAVAAPVPASTTPNSLSAPSSAQPTVPSTAVPAATTPTEEKAAPATDAVNTAPSPQTTPNAVNQAPATTSPSAPAPTKI